MTLNDARIGVIGLGYVGLPLAIEFGKRYPTVGFDIKPERVAELEAGRDSTLEATPEDLAAAKHLTYTTDKEALRDCNVYIVTVPTPVSKDKRPLLSPLRGASQTIGQVISKGDVVVYESTVYPGCTEEFCIPIIERESGFTLNRDFYAGYSPERINPGDKEHRLPTIRKITSGSTPEAAEFIDALYRSIVTAGTHKASSIKVAEAAKVIENTQRDLNIALMNELAMIFDRLDIDTIDVLEAASTKWNFLPFRPGLVGGHCIGVDPYYLTAKAEEVGYAPHVILAGRRINDGMGAFVAQKVVRMLAAGDAPLKRGRVGVLGLTFKENVPDLRNSRVPDIVSELASYGVAALVHDPLADAEEAKREYGIELQPLSALTDLDALVLAVPHRELVEQASCPSRFLRPGGVLIDVKAALRGLDLGDVLYWSL
ncbi:MAG: nucleotide sugar dehydrogenase [Gammaproteobacteria bacterium]